MIQNNFQSSLQISSNKIQNNILQKEQEYYENSSSSDDLKSIKLNFKAPLNEEQEQQKAKQNDIIIFLKRPSSLRTASEIQKQMKNCNEIISYFKTLQLTDKQIHKILQKLQYEFHQAGQNVFQYGDYGDKFYLIVQGEVAVWIPQNFRTSVFTNDGFEKSQQLLLKNEQSLLKGDLTLRDLLHSKSNNEENSFSQVSDFVEKIKNQQTLTQSKSKQENTFNNNDSQEIIKISSRNDTSHEDIKKTFPKPKSQEQFDQIGVLKNKQLFQKVANLQSGKFFGELALINKKPRAATIKTITDCHFATLDRRTFQIIQKHHENILDQKVQLLREVPYFDEISKVALMKYQNYFHEKKHIRGSVIMKEGYPMTHLHLVIEGEYEVSKNIEIIKNVNKFDYKEFLPHTSHQFKKNEKNPRFMSSVENFVYHQPFDQNDNLRLALVQPYRLLGLHDVTNNNRTYSNTVKCVTQTGKTIAIQRDDFLFILYQKDSEISQNLRIKALQSELGILDMIEKRGKLKQKIEQYQQLDNGKFIMGKLNKQVDEELLVMDEIRKQNFDIKDKDIQNILLNAQAKESNEENIAIDSTKFNEFKSQQQQQNSIILEKKDIKINFLNKHIVPESNRKQKEIYHLSSKKMKPAQHKQFTNEQYNQNFSEKVQEQEVINETNETDISKQAYNNQDGPYQSNFVYQLNEGQRNQNKLNILSVSNDITQIFPEKMSAAEYSNYQNINYLQQKKRPRTKMGDQNERKTNDHQNDSKSLNIIKELEIKKDFNKSHVNFYQQNQLIQSSQYNVGNFRNNIQNTRTDQNSNGQKYIQINNNNLLFQQQNQQNDKSQFQRLINLNDQNSIKPNQLDPQKTQVQNQPIFQIKQQTLIYQQQDKSSRSSMEAYKSITGKKRKFNLSKIEIQNQEHKTNQKIKEIHSIPSVQLKALGKASSIHQNPTQYIVHDARIKKAKQLSYYKSTLESKSLHDNENKIFNNQKVQNRFSEIITGQGSARKSNLQQENQSLNTSYNKLNELKNNLAQNSLKIYQKQKFQKKPSINEQILLKENQSQSMQEINRDQLKKDSEKIFDLLQKNENLRNLIVSHIQSSERVQKLPKSQHISKRQAIGVKSDLNNYDKATNFQLLKGANTQSLLDNRKTSVNSEQIDFKQKSGNIFYQHNLGLNIHLKPQSFDMKKEIKNINKAVKLSYLIQNKEAPYKSHADILQNVKSVKKVKNIYDNGYESLMYLQGDNSVFNQKIEIRQKNRKSESFRKSRQPNINSEQFKTESLQNFLKLRDSQQQKKAIVVYKNQKPLKQTKFEFQINYS